MSEGSEYDKLQLYLIARTPQNNTVMVMLCLTSTSINFMCNILSVWQQSSALLEIICHPCVASGGRFIALTKICLHWKICDFKSEEELL